MAIERVKHWQLGDIRITRIFELKDQCELSFLLPEGTADTVKKYPWLKPHFATPEGQILVWFQAFVLTFRDRRIMVDTCVGNDKMREFELFTKTHTAFLEDLTAAGCPPETIDTVLCTHLHLDHVGWNTRLANGRWVPTFPNARYLFGRAEWEYWQNRLPEKSIQVQHLTDSILPIIDAGLAVFVEPSHRVSDEVWLEPTPGHTPGHVSVHVASQGHHAIISGDIFHNPIQFAEPDLPSAFCIDAKKACHTRREFLARYQDKKALIVGSHFCDPTVGWIVRDGKNWRFDYD
ncbi:MAG: MBL fold metallo-hydrolase [Acidobacteriia bacterium]|nr:MBL fold metallo-hydrolase [Terriglobia bacterium]